MGYYNLFENQKSYKPPMFKESENYIMRFNSKLSYYPYDGNSLTIIYFKQGAGELIIEGERTTIENDKFIIANPNSDWEYVNNKLNRIDVLSFVLSESLISKFLHGSMSSIERLLDQPYESRKEDFFFTNHAFDVNHYRTGSVLSTIYEKSNLENFGLNNPYEIAYEVLQSVFMEQLKANYLMPNVVANRISTRKEVFKRMLIAYEYIHDNISRSISIKELAQVSALSEFHLYKSFKRVFGKTPHQYINQERMKRAKELIASGHCSISEVAFALDFPDLPSFSKLYKKTFGITPSKT